MSLIASVLTLSLLLLSGCSHQNLIESGQKHLAQQQFELAVAQFEQALAEKPNHQPTIVKLQQAKDALNRWALQLEHKADLARNSSQLAKAMLLYSKVAQLNQSPHSIDQYKSIYHTIRKESSVHAKLIPSNVGVSERDVLEIDGLILHGNGDAPMQLLFKQSNPIFEIQQSKLTKSVEYVSGSQLISNPEFSEIQHQIRHHQNNNHNLRNKLTSNQRRLSKYDNELNRLKNQQLSSQQRLLKTKISATERQKINSELAKINQKITTLEQKTSNVQQQEDKYQHKLSHNSDKLSRLIDQLNYTPAVISAPVYSDYHYQVQHQENSLSAQLYLTDVKQRKPSIRAAQVIVRSIDESHPAHPTVGLPADPMALKDQRQLTGEFSNELKQIARRLLKELVDEKRHQFLREASQTANIDRQFSLWVKHAMVTKEGPLPDIAQKIQQTLIMEYGIGGEFNIEELLHRYQ